MKKLAILVAFTLGLSASSWAVPEGWVESRNGPVTEWSSPRSASLLPVEWTVQFRAPTGASITVSAVASPDVQPLLSTQLRVVDDSHALVSVSASGESVDIVDSGPEKAATASGELVYGWRYPAVGNLWDDRTRAEIGASLDSMVPFLEKLFTLRLTLKNGFRQVWLDDRLVGEMAASNPMAASLQIEFQDVLIEDIQTVSIPDSGSFLPLPLSTWSHAKTSVSPIKPGERFDVLKPQKPGLPMWLPPAGAVDLDLGASLYRLRLSGTRSLDSSLVKPEPSWPGAFSIDPATLAFRVPNRPWQAVWLLAWLDDEKGAVPQGVMRFYEPGSGHPVDMPFEISETAVHLGLVRKVERKSPEGQALYLVKVPIETGLLDELRQRNPCRLSFELTKPLALFRGYPEPGYSGFYPAGPPSSIHIIGLTLEEAPFDYTVKPTRPGHVFMRPEKPAYTIAITNRSNRSLALSVKLGTESFNGTEQGIATGSLVLAKRASGEVKLDLDPRLNGWHALQVRVEGDGVVRSNRLSLVLLPPDSRTRGYAENETRFGIASACTDDLPFKIGDATNNEAWLSVFSKLGLRRMVSHPAFSQTNLPARFGFVTSGPRLFVSDLDGISERDPKAISGLVSQALARVEADVAVNDARAYVYGGRWREGRHLQYGHRDDGGRLESVAERTELERQVKLFEAVAEALRYRDSKTRLILQGDGPFGPLVYMRTGLLKVFVDGFSVTGPMGGLIPENPAAPGSLQGLWAFNRDAAAQGWTNRPVMLAVDPFLSTQPGALTEKQQADYLIRHWLAGLSFHVSAFESGVTAIDPDCGSSESGLFHRTPSHHPKPSVAALATATTMLCGFDPAGSVDTGVPTTLCMAFRHAVDGTMRFALWRVTGKARAVLRIEGKRAVLTDGMGNEQALPVLNGSVTLTVSESPVWLSGVERINAIRIEFPEYEDTPAAVTRPVASFTARQWTYEKTPDPAITNRHVAAWCIAEPAMSAEFEPGEAGHAEVLTVVLPVGPLDKPLARRCGVLKAKRPVPVLGNPKALGVWVRGNGSWGRIAYRIRDAKGELWTSTGSKEAWLADDPAGYSFVHFEGWRYVRIPLPGVAPRDGARRADTAWWGCSGGNGIPEPPYTLQDLVLEACNEVPVAGELALVPERVYKLAGLVAEYATEGDTMSAAVPADPLPEWQGPRVNPMARLMQTGTDTVPVIGRFDQPTDEDGTGRLIRFAAKPGMTYNLYVSRVETGAGAELLAAGVASGMRVDGFRPGVLYYLFLTATGRDGKELKPSKPFRLVIKAE